MATSAQGHTVKSFGRDCLGNISGYRVVGPAADFWRDKWFGNIYEPGSFEKAHQTAKARAAELNGA